VAHPRTRGRGEGASDDLVSQADRDTERIIRTVLARHRPGDAVLGEESGTGGVRWIVDAIDGTANYLYGRPDWAVSVAAADAADGTLPAGVVLEPVLGRSTEARRGGGTVADGVLLVQEAGGTNGDLGGPVPGTWPASGDVLAAADPLWRALRGTLTTAWTQPDPVC
jgi:hypothetical protein